MKGDVDRDGGVFSQGGPGEAVFSPRHWYPRPHVICFVINGDLEL
jgi:hypothetical protein